MLNFEIIGRIFPRKFVKSIDAKLQRAGLEWYAEEFLGLLIIVSLLLTLAMIFSVFAFAPLEKFFVFLSTSLFGKNADSGSLAFGLLVSLVSFLVMLSFVALFAWMYLDYKEEQRRTEIERHLPDYLMLIAANVKAGVLIEHAIWDAAKPEFGLLSVEMERIAKLAIGGKSFPEILQMFNQRVGSRAINQLVYLLEESMAAGGEIAKVLEQTAAEMRRLTMLQRDISSSLLMYGIFVLFAAIVMTPLLFALSYNLVVMLTKVFAKVPPYRMNLGVSAISFTSPKITADAFFWFSVVAVIFTSLSSMMIYGILRNGNYLSGIRLFPAVVILTLVLFMLMIDTFSKMFTTV